MIPTIRCNCGRVKFFIITFLLVSLCAAPLSEAGFGFAFGSDGISNGPNNQAAKNKTQGDQLAKQTPITAKNETDVAKNETGVAKNKTDVTNATDIQGDQLAQLTPITAKNETDVTKERDVEAEAILNRLIQIMSVNVTDAPPNGTGNNTDSISDNKFMNSRVSGILRDMREQFANWHIFLQLCLLISAAILAVSAILCCMTR